MLGSKWLQLQYLLMNCFVLVSVFLNTCLIILVSVKSPKNLGPYKHLMQFISLFEIFYSITAYLIFPVMHSYGSSFFIMTPIAETIFTKPVALVVQAVWCGCFGASMAIFGIHFIYRFLAVTGYPSPQCSFRIRSFQKPPHLHFQRLEGSCLADGSYCLRLHLGNHSLLLLWP